MALSLRIRDKPTETGLWRRIRHSFNHGHDRAYRIETTTMSGFPDVIWFPTGRPAVLIELKAGPLRIGPWQKKLFFDLETAGHPVWVLWQKEKRTDPLVYTSTALSEWGEAFIGEDLSEWIAKQRNPNG